MSGVPKPDNCILDGFEKWKVCHGRQVWRSLDERRYYTWDSLHGEVEVYNARLRHLGALDATTGDLIKPAIKGRHLEC